MRKSNPKHISNSIKSVFHQLGLGIKLREYEILDAWPRIVGKQIAKVTNAERINDGKLFIHVASSTWRSELVFLKKELIRKINQAMNQEIVKDIIFR